MNPNHIDFFTDQAVNITTDPIQVAIGEVSLFAGGDIFGGATVTLEFSPDIELIATPNDAEWFTHPDGVFTEKGWKNASLSDGLIRAKVEGATGTTLVSLKMRPRLTHIAHV